METTCFHSYLFGSHIFLLAYLKKKQYLATPLAWTLRNIFLFYLQLKRWRYLFVFLSLMLWIVDQNQNVFVSDGLNVCSVFLTGFQCQTLQFLSKAISLTDEVLLLSLSLPFPFQVEENTPSGPLTPTPSTGAASTVTEPHLLRLLSRLWLSEIRSAGLPGPQVVVSGLVLIFRCVIGSSEAAGCFVFNHWCSAMSELSLMTRLVLLRSWFTLRLDRSPFCCSLASSWKIKLDPQSHHQSALL